MNEKLTPVIIVDDHKMVRDGFTHIIESSDNYQVIGAYSSVKLAIESEMIAQAKIVITDIAMGDEDGFSLVKYIKEQRLSCKILVLSMYENSIYLQQAKSLGVDGFLHKREASESMLKALDAIKQGKSYFSNETAEKFEQAETDLCKFNQLYPREREVFLLLAKGYSVKQIAYDMDISIKTVHTHRLNLFKKFGFSTPVEIIKFALQHGILEYSDL